jgi:hypothetical protein
MKTLGGAAFLVLLMVLAGAGPARAESFVDWEVLDTLEPDGAWETVTPDTCELGGGDCPQGFACWIGQESVECFASNGKGREEPCDPAAELLDCADGLFCIGELGAATCKDLCVADSGCAGTEHCLGPVLEEGIYVGICVCDDLNDDGTCDDQQDITSVPLDTAAPDPDPVDAATDGQGSADSMNQGDLRDGTLADQSSTDDLSTTPPKSKSGGCNLATSAPASGPWALFLLLGMVVWSASRRTLR